MQGLQGSSSLEVFEHLIFIVPKLLAAVFCGGLIGLERELKSKPAGIKTNILICLGSTVFTAISVLLSALYADRNFFGDPARLAAQIVSGIGFLGAGVIIQARGTIIGLTTAATIWVVASVGVVIGLGHAEIGLVVSFFTVMVLVSASFFEDRVLGRSLSFLTELVVDDPHGEVRRVIQQELQKNDLVLDSFDLNSRGDLGVIQMRYSGHRRDQKAFTLGLWGIPGVKEIKQL